MNKVDRDNISFKTHQFHYGVQEQTHIHETKAQEVEFAFLPLLAISGYQSPPGRACQVVRPQVSIIRIWTCFFSWRNYFPIKLQIKQGKKKVAKIGGERWQNKNITLGNYYHSLARQTSRSCYPICKVCNSHWIVRFSKGKSWSIQSKCSQLVNNFLRMAGLVWESPGYQRFFWGLTMMIKVINRILMPINTLIKKTTPFQFFQLLAGPEKCLTTAGFFGRKYLLKSVNKKVAASQLTSFNEPVSL